MESKITRGEREAIKNLKSDDSIQIIGVDS